MGRKILVYCDAHKAEENKEVEAQVVDITLRISDPNDIGNIRVLTGTIEICADHQTPITHLADMLDSYGSRLKDDAEQLLVNAVRLGARAEETEYWLCYDCTPPKKLKGTSLYSHSDNIHGRPKREIDYRPYAEGKDAIPGT